MSPLCPHCFARMPAGAPPCDVKPNLIGQRRVICKWEEDGREVRGWFPEACLQLASEKGPKP